MTDLLPIKLQTLKIVHGSQLGVSGNVSEYILTVSLGMKIYTLDEAGPSETSDVLTAMLMPIAIVWQILTGVALSSLFNSVTKKDVVSSFVDCVKINNESAALEMR